MMLRRRLGICSIKGVRETDAFDRLLLHAVHDVGCLNTSSFEYGRDHVDNVRELHANVTRVLDMMRPYEQHAVLVPSTTCALRIARSAWLMLQSFLPIEEWRCSLLRRGPAL